MDTKNELIQNKNKNETMIDAAFDVLEIRAERKGRKGTISMR